MRFFPPGENQLPYYPGLARGLVAVLLYCDGRNSVVDSLRMLIQAREGRTFTMGVGEELVSTATKFTDQLMAEGLTYKVLGEYLSGLFSNGLAFEWRVWWRSRSTFFGFCISGCPAGLLREIDEPKEMSRLQQERGLGNARHRKQVRRKTLCSLSNLKNECLKWHNILMSTIHLGRGGKQARKQISGRHLLEYERRKSVSVAAQCAYEIRHVLQQLFNGKLSYLCRCRI